MDIKRVYEIEKEIESYLKHCAYSRWVFDQHKSGMTREAYSMK